MNPIFDAHRRAQEEKEAARYTLEGVDSAVNETLGESALQTAGLLQLGELPELFTWEELDRQVKIALYIEEAAAGELDSSSFCIVNSLYNYFVEAVYCYAGYPEFWERVQQRVWANVLACRSNFMDVSCLNKSGFLNAEELLDRTEVQCKMSAALSKKKPWELINAFDVLPSSVFCKNKPELFLRSRTKKAIRLLFRYRKSAVPDLTEIGFIESLSRKVLYVVQDSRTKSTWVCTDTAYKAKYNHILDKNGDKFTGQIRVFKKAYNEIIGIDKAKHLAFIKEYARVHKKLYAEAHRVKHKAHITHTRPNRKATKFIRVNGGELLTVREYSRMYNVCLATAYKMVNVTVDKDGQESGDSLLS